MARSYKVKNLIMYHFHDKNKYDDLWQVGNVIDNTSENFINDFCGSGENYCPGLDGDGEDYYLVDGILYYLDLLENGTNFSNEKAIVVLQDIRKGIINYQTTIRELALEEVRKDYYPNRISRKNCIWLCSKAQLEFWKEEFSKRKISLYKVEVTGEIFKTNEGLLPRTRDSYISMLNDAHKYWNPKLSEVDEENMEYLFRGKIRVLEKL